MHKFRNWFDDLDFARDRLRGSLGDAFDGAPRRPRGGPGGGPHGGPHGGPFGGPFGPGGGGGPGGGPGGGWWGALFGGGGRRQRRGNVRFAILTLLGEGPHNGYQMMQAIEQRSHGTWRPSSGSIYPTLQQLEDEGLIAASDKGQSRTFALTDAGRAYVKEHADELEADWDLGDDANPWSGDPRVEMMAMFKGVALAAMQVAQTGTPKQIEEAKRQLTEMRRALYRILAETPAPDDDDE